MDDPPIIAKNLGKRCPTCKAIKSLTEFYKDSSRKDGYRHTCKKCHGKSVKKWQLKNVEKFKEVNRNWKTAHKEQRARESKQWAKAHPEYRRRVGQAWRASHPDYGENWRKKNRSRMANYAQNRRAQFARVRHELTNEEWEAIIEFFGHKCLCCGRENVKLTIDHVLPISLGGTHTADNVQPLCGPCNSRKKAKHIDYRKEAYAPTRD